MKKLLNDQAVLIRIIRTFSLLAHTTTDFGVWAGGAEWGARIVLSYLRAGFAPPQDNELAVRFSKSRDEVIMDRAVIGVVRLQFEGWQRQLEGHQVRHPERFRLFEEALNSILKELDQVNPRKGGQS
jgi:hypothetical protein